MSVAGFPAAPVQPADHPTVQPSTIDVSAMRHARGGGGAKPGAALSSPTTNERWLAARDELQAVGQ